MTESIDTTRQRMGRTRSKAVQPDMSRAYQRTNEEGEKKKMTLMIPKELHKRLKHLSADRDESIVSLIVSAIEDKYPRQP